MSPLSLLYLLMASPMFGSHFENVGEFTPSSYMPNWTPESSNWWWPSGSSPSWYTPESSTFGFPETSNINWFLRKAIRPSSIFSRRSILRELTGHEDTFSTFSTSNVEKINAKLLVKIVNKLALINPITIEKIITRPESRLLISKVLRTAEPETLYLIERIVRKVVPRVHREKIERRLLKKIVRSTIFTSPRSSILSSVYSPRPEKYIMKKWIKKALRNTPVNPMMLCNLCESVCTGYSYSTPYSYNLPICSMCSNMCPTTFSMRTSRRHHSVKSVEKKLIKKVLRNVVRKEIIAKELLKTVVPSKKSLYSSLHSNVDICSICSTVCEPTNFYTTTRVSPICNTCNAVCSSPSYYKVKTMNKLYSRLF